MCSTTVVEIEMACGHTIRPTTNAAQQPGRNGQEQPPPTRVVAHDTCANCDREAHIHKSKLLYDTQHAELTRRYVEAKRTGDSNEMVRLERRILAVYQETRRKIAALSKIPSSPDVFWPSMDTGEMF